MDKREAIEILKAYLSLASKKYNILHAYLFGSYAKDSSHKHSDIDIALIIDDFSDYFDTQVDLMYLTRTIDSRIEPHPFKLEDFNHDDPLAHEVLEYGIEIPITQQHKTADMVAETQDIYITKKQ